MNDKQQVAVGDELKIHFPIVDKDAGTARMVPCTIKYLGTKLYHNGVDFYDFQNVKNGNAYCFSISELEVLTGGTHEECESFEF